MAGTVHYGNARSDGDLSAVVFSGIGVLIYYSLVQEASSQIRLDVILPTVFAIAICYLPIHILFLKGFLENSRKSVMPRYFARFVRRAPFIICCFCFSKRQIARRSNGLYVRAAAV